MARHILALALALCGSAAIAQDGSETSSKRSVEGAQRFLAELVQAGGATASYMVGEQKVCGYYCKKEGPYPVTTYVIWELDHIEALSRCSTRVFFKPGSAKLWINYQVNSRFKVTEAPYVDIDWSSSGGQDAFYNRDAQAGHRILFKANQSPTYGNWFKLSFLQLPAETDQRVTVAIDYLIDNCARPSTTGF